MVVAHRINNLVCGTLYFQEKIISVNFLATYKLNIGPIHFPLFYSWKHF